MRNNYSSIHSCSESSIHGCYDINKVSSKKRRLCLKCGERFLSVGPHNRLCDECVSINEKIAFKIFCVSSKYIDELKD